MPDDDLQAYRVDLRERALALVGELAPKLAAAGSASEGGDLLADAYRELFDADWCRFWWVDPDQPVARVLSHSPPTEFTEPWQTTKRLDDGKPSIVATVINGGEGAIEPNPAKNPNIEPRYVSVYGAKSGAHFPMKVGSRTVGDMGLVSQREHEHFHEDDADVLRLLAAFASVALHSLGASEAVRGPAPV